MALEKDLFAQDPDHDFKNPGGSGGDLEGAKAEGETPYGSSNKSAGARIAPVLPHLRGYDFGSDDSGSDILGKQIELEAGNDIRYRTCSWPKASISTRLSSSNTPPGRSVLTLAPRLRLFSFLSIFAWLLCLSRTRTRFLALFRASS
jgi:hypothetical protein